MDRGGTKIDPTYGEDFSESSYFFDSKDDKQSMQKTADTLILKMYREGKEGFRNFSAAEQKQCLLFILEKRQLPPYKENGDGEESYPYFDFNTLFRISKIPPGELGNLMLETQRLELLSYISDLLPDEFFTDDVVEQMCCWKACTVVMDNLSRIKYDRKKIGTLLFNNDCPNLVLENIDKFPDLDKKKMLSTLIERAKIFREEFNQANIPSEEDDNYSYDNSDYNEETPNTYWTTLSENLNFFSAILDINVARQIINTVENGVLIVCQNRKLFKNVTHKDIAHLAISAGLNLDVILYLYEEDIFKSLEIPLALMIDSPTCIAVLEKIKSGPLLKEKETSNKIFNKIIDLGIFTDVYNYFSNSQSRSISNLFTIFTNLSLETAKKTYSLFFETTFDEGLSIAKILTYHLGSFSNLDEEFFLTLATNQANKSAGLARSLGAFSNLSQKTFQSLYTEKNVDQIRHIFLGLRAFRGLDKNAFDSLLNYCVDPKSFYSHDNFEALSDNLASFTDLNTDSLMSLATAYPLSLTRALLQLPRIVDLQLEEKFLRFVITNEMSVLYIYRFVDKITNITEETAQLLYEKFFKYLTDDILKQTINTMKDKTGIPPRNEMLKKRAVEFVEKGWMGDAEIALSYIDNADTVKNVREKISLVKKYKKALQLRDEAEYRYFSIISSKTENLASEPTPEFISQWRTQFFLEAHGQPGQDTAKVIRNGYTCLLENMDNGVNKLDLIWAYLGQRNRHDLLQHVPNFIGVLNKLEQTDGKSRKKIFTRLVKIAGQGTGLSSTILKEIMGVMTADVWLKLEQESAYHDEQPPLSDIENLNLQKIRNEIRLQLTPEIKQQIENLPAEKEKLRRFASELLKHPTIDTSAIMHFVSDPTAFFQSRTGAGEDGELVRSLLTALEPGNMPGCNEEMIRDAIVEGSYDRLNAFPPVIVEWFEDEQLERALTGIHDLVAAYDHDLDAVGVFLEEVMQKLSVIKTEPKNTFNDLFQNFRCESFCSYLEKDAETTQKFWAHFIKSKNSIIEKACEFATKRALAERSAQKKKYEKGVADAIEKKSREQDPTKMLHLDSTIKNIENDLALVEKKISEIVAHLQMQKDDIMKLANTATEEIDTSLLKDFWREIFATGWLKSMRLDQMVSRITQEIIESEQSIFSQHAISMGGDKLKKTVSDWANTIKNTATVKWYRAEVYKPSDPASVTPGSTTSSCDAFGHGKKAHFMITPGTAQFTLSEHRGSRPLTWDTGDIIEQSILTDSRQLFDSSKQRSDFFKKILSQDGKIGKTIEQIFPGMSPQEFLVRYANSAKEITLDSAEVPANFKETHSPEDIYYLLKKVFLELAQRDPAYASNVTVGRQYSYLNSEKLPKGKNTGIWSTPLAYSDNLPSLFETDGNSTEQDYVIVLIDTVHSVKKETAGIRAAQPTDSFAIALMEDIAFSRSNGTQHITGWISIAQQLYAACIQAEHYHHNPLAFLSVGEQAGQMTYDGYLIAHHSGENEIYITDTATTGTGKGVGQKLLLSLLNSVATDPSINGRTITMDCRGATSAKLIAKPANRIALENLEFTDKNGQKIKYKVEGPEFETINGDELFPFRFVPHSN